MALTGHLSDLSLSELIEFFCNQRKTGQLKVLYPQGPGYFALQAGSVIDAQIGVLRGIDAVYFALTLPNARFEFGDAIEPPERTINQPWTQVVLEGLRRLDEGIAPLTAFPPEYKEAIEEPSPIKPEENFAELESLRVPAFLSFTGSGVGSKRKIAIASGVAFAVVASVAAIGVPAGWYHRAKASAVGSQPSTNAAVIEQQAAPAAQPVTNDVSTPVETAPANAHSEDAALAAKRQRERDKAKRDEQAQAKPAAANPATPVPTVATEAAKSGPRKIAVTVTYDESGRVTQASGGDASAIRIARQKRFPAGKAGSATITIPIN
jgi:hypothetical protein